MAWGSLFPLPFRLFPRRAGQGKLWNHQLPCSLKCWRPIISWASWPHELKVFSWFSQVPTINGISGRSQFMGRDPHIEVKRKMGELTFLSLWAKSWPDQPALGHPPSYLPPSTVAGRCHQWHQCSLGRLPSLSKHPRISNTHPDRNLGRITQSHLIEGQGYSICDASSRGNHISTWKCDLVWSRLCSYSALPLTSHPIVTLVAFYFHPPGLCSC